MTELNAIIGKPGNTSTAKVRGVSVGFGGSRVAMGRYTSGRWGLGSTGIGRPMRDCGCFDRRRQLVDVGGILGSPASLPAISAARRRDCSFGFANLQHSRLAQGDSCLLPPCGGDVRQDRRGAVCRTRRTVQPCSACAPVSGRIAMPSTPQRLLQIGDQIVAILDPRRQPHQRIRNADRGALLGRDRAMRHQRRVLDQAFDAAEAFGQREQLRAFEEAFGAGEVAVEHRPMIMPPKACICRLAMACCGWLARPG